MFSARGRDGREVALAQHSLLVRRFLAYVSRGLDRFLVRRASDIIYYPCQILENRRDIEL